MSGKRKFRKSVDKLNIRKVDRLVEIPGLLGLKIGGVQEVEVPGREGYVYVRLRDNLNEVAQAYNSTVSPVYDLPVLLIRDQVNKSRWVVKGRDEGRYNNWGSSAYLPRHHSQHEFDPNAPGGDVVWVYDKQWRPFGVTPSGSSGAGNVLTNDTLYFQNGAWNFLGYTGTQDILAYKPTGSWARMVLVYADDNGTPQLTAGSFFSAIITGTAYIKDYIPNVPNSNTDYPLAAIRLVSGTSKILWGNIYRTFLLGGNGGADGHVIQDDGVSQTQRTKLNFVGSGLVAYDDAGNDATIVSGVAAGVGHVIQDDGVSKTQRANLNFVGTNFVVYDDAGNDATIVSGTATTGTAVTWDGTIYDPMIAPATPNAKDDEFSDSSVDVKWTEWDRDSIFVASEDVAGLKMYLTSGSFDERWAGLLQAAPSVPFSVWTNVSTRTPIASDHKFGIIIGDGLIANATGTFYVAADYVGGAGAGIQVLRYTDYTTLSGSIYNIQYHTAFSLSMIPKFYRVRVEAGNKLSVDTSMDGASWGTVVERYSMDFTPQDIGLAVWSDNNAIRPTWQVKFFRVTASGNSEQSLIPDRRVRYEVL